VRSGYGEYAAKKIAAHRLAKDFIPAEMENAQQRLLDANKIWIKTEKPGTSKERKRIKPGPRSSNASDEEPL
jgi:hypothetical protein